jgi:hypothetical protein
VEVVDHEKQLAGTKSCKKKKAFLEVNRVGDEVITQLMHKVPQIESMRASNLREHAIYSKGQHS